MVSAKARRHTTVGGGVRQGPSAHRSRQTTGPKPRRQSLLEVLHYPQLYTCVCTRPGSSTCPGRPPKTDADIKRVTRAPWQSLPSILMLNLRPSELSMCVRDLLVEGRLAMNRAVRGSACFQVAWQDMSRATESGEAMLWPWRPRHDATSILAGRQALTHLDDQRP